MGGEVQAENRKIILIKKLLRYVTQNIKCCRCDSRDAQVQRGAVRGGSQSWAEPLRRPDADTYEAFQSTEELLHLRIRTSSHFVSIHITLPTKKLIQFKSRHASLVLTAHSHPIYTNTPIHYFIK